MLGSAVLRRIFTCLLLSSTSAYAAELEGDPKSGSAPSFTAESAASTQLAPILPKAGPRYSLPFQLRSAAPKTGVRLDTIVAPYEFEGSHALEAVVLASTQIRLLEHLFVTARWGFDDNRIGNGARNRTGITNPSFGVSVPVALGPMFRFAASTSIAIPISTGGGENPDPDAVLLQRQAALARAAMENGTFLLNEVAVPTGLSLAFITGGFTAQIDWTVISSGRVKGPANGHDGARINTTMGAFLGYYVIPELSLGTEFRYQYFIIAPAAVSNGMQSRENMSAGLGARLDLELSDTMRARPGICYSVGLAGQLAEQSFKMVQFDIPIVF